MIPVAINEDLTFFISEDGGDVRRGADAGLYYKDVRFLSCYEFRIAGLQPERLASRNLEYFRAVHILTNPAFEGVSEGAVTIKRTQTVGNGFHEDIDITNYHDAPIMLPLEIVFDADYAHIFEVRGMIVVGEDVKRRHPGKYEAFGSKDGRSVTFSYAEDEYHPTTTILFSRPLELSPDGKRVSADARIAPRDTWHLCLDISTSATPKETSKMGPGHSRVERPGGPRQLREQEEKLVLLAPRLSTDNYLLERAYRRSVMDLAALRLKGEEVITGEYILAAGIPWFMALFGRDSLIASYQALPYIPEIAKGTLRVLAQYQGKKVDPVSGEEPGKILHEFRSGPTMGSHVGIPTWPYYGTIDATPLFIILISEVYRTLGDLSFLRELFGNAEQALLWMDRYGDRDGDGYLEYIRETEAGLENQGWKDSWDAIRFRDGHIATPPIAPCEVQGYAYDAKIRMAELYEVLGNAERGKELRRQAEDLRERFNRDFWLADRHCFALALDGEKKPVDGLASNQGHDLWSGIVEEDKARDVVGSLMSSDMFSGWGVRTMGRSEGGYSPLGYHIGSVWPHDNSLIAAGFVRYGFRQEAARILQGILGIIAAQPEPRLPELFSGCDRDEVPFPVGHPVASGIQAWASGTPLLLLTSLLGLFVDFSKRKIYLSPYLPEGTNRLDVDAFRIGDGELQLTVERVYGEVQTRLRQVPRGFKVEGTVFRWSIFW